jgi:hypothetical protein
MKSVDILRSARESIEMLSGVEETALNSKGLRVKTEDGGMFLVRVERLDDDEESEEEDVEDDEYDENNDDEDEDDEDEDEDEDEDVDLE